MSQTPAIRILDASANRAAEGLRVVEDYVRFVLDDALLTRLLKQTRHELAGACGELGIPTRAAARDTQADVGTSITTPSEAQRLDTWAVCQASLERSKQSLRSLEEYSKVAHPELAARFEALRYQLYTIEKALTLNSTSRLRLREVTLCTLITGQESLEAFAEMTSQLLEAGVGMIQLRDKNLSDRKLLMRADFLVRKARATESTLVIINDRPDIAAASGADGVHLGQDDLTVKDARSILGTEKLIGVSTHNIEQARQAVLDGANYLGAGPTFPSATKQFDAFPGLDYLRQVAAEITLPTFAIGGINVENLQQVLDTGITRVAVSSAATSSAELLKKLSAEHK